MGIDHDLLKNKARRDRSDPDRIDSLFQLHRYTPAPDLIQHTARPHRLMISDLKIIRNGIQNLHWNTVHGHCILQSVLCCHRIRWLHIEFRFIIPRLLCHDAVFDIRCPILCICVGIRRKCFHRR